jgi:phosphatidylethanolamine-binding protein (PEBP) family uncharacterized protein/uncharacterized membrane protein YgcG
VLAGCGGGGSSSSGGSSSFATPGAPGSHALASGEAVAYISGAPVLKSSYEHWLAVEQATGGSSNAGHRALGFLLTSSWVLGEAAARHISIPEAEVKKRFETLEHQSFPKSGQLQTYLSHAHETSEDLLARVRSEMLLQRIASDVASRHPSSQRTSVLASFQESFQAHWKALTSCLPAYVMEDCKQYKGAPENLTASTSGSSSSSASGSASRSTSGGSKSGGSKSGGSSSGSASSGSSASGQVYTAPGAFSISSSAFERNGAIPAEYTCAGKGISPPLSWEKVPSGAAELVLFVIDDNSTGSSGGIRWIVGGIDPSSKGVAAGQTPPGGIVGTNTAGKAAYSAICPAKGKSDTIEFVMYALKKTISLSPGFQPAVAEHDYGAGKLILGQAAVNYAVASR